MEFIATFFAGFSSRRWKHTRPDIGRGRAIEDAAGDALDRCATDFA
jgi:hypothetical protein